MSRITLSLIVLLFGFSLASQTLADDRPNILWISCEDISCNLGCYDDPHAITPNLDQLAKGRNPFLPCLHSCGSLRGGAQQCDHGHVSTCDRFTAHAQSNDSAAERKGIFGKCSAPQDTFAPTAAKTDYQFNATPSMWDRNGNKHKDWRERPDPKQPFFSVVNITVSHESQVRHGEQRHAQVNKANWRRQKARSRQMCRHTTRVFPADNGGPKGLGVVPR